MEPARSDEIARAPGADADDRRGWPQNQPPTSADPARALWPWTFPTASRQVPVVGPTEALRGRADGQAMPLPSDAVPGLTDPARRSSWQLAQEVWQESGVAWETAAPEREHVDPAAGWLPEGEPAGVARLTYAPAPTNLRDPEPASFDPAYLDPAYAEPAYAEPPYAEPPYAEPAYVEPAYLDPAYVEPGYVEPGYATTAYVEPADPAPVTATAWFADHDPVDEEPAARQAPAPDAWPGYPDLDDGDPDDPQPADHRCAAADAWPGAPEPSDREPADPEQTAPDERADRRPRHPIGFTAADSAGFEPVDDEAFGGPGPAATWFTGVGPADSRFADTRSAAPGVQRDQPGRWGPPGHPGPVGPGQGRFAPRPGPTWNEYPPDGFPGQAWPAGAGRMPLGAPVALDLQAPESASLTEPFIAAEPDGGAPGWAGRSSFSEPDELFRAWQGSVNEAAAARGHWSMPRRAASASRRRRALHAAAIGVPVVVIVTVGAGALMMLTGKANDMLAVRADTGTASPTATATGTSGTHTGAQPTAGAVPPAFARAALSGYPGQHGTVTVASMMAAAGATVAVGTADSHPAIWRRAANGSWTLESAASLSAVPGSAGLASVTDGPAGWIAVGTTSDGRSTGPLVFASADGVQWQPVTSLTAQAGAGTEFLGAAAGRSGYVLAGRQMVGGRAFAVLWYSADLRSWTSDDNGGLDGRLAASTANAITATADGFVAVGSHGADQSMWVSTDGQHWRLDYVTPPAGGVSATLGSVVASGASVVAGGYAATRAGDIPVIVVSADGGGHWRQVVLQAPDGLGVITALTATPRGFTAAGLVGRSGAQHAVTWTSADGLTWSGPVQTDGPEITALALLGGTVAGTAEQGATPTLVPLPAP